MEEVSRSRPETRTVGWVQKLKPLCRPAGEQLNLADPLAVASPRLFQCKKRYIWRKIYKYRFALSDEINAYSSTSLDSRHPRASARNQLPLPSHESLVEKKRESPAASLSGACISLVFQTAFIVPACTFPCNKRGPFRSVVYGGISGQPWSIPFASPTDYCEPLRENIIYSASHVPAQNEKGAVNRQ